MTFIVTTGYAVERVAAPSLPLAPNEWDRQFHDQYSNVLRLYFNRLDNFTTRLLASDVIPAQTSYTVATLPSAASLGAGARTFVTDASGPTFGSTVVGGGAVFVPVYSDGTNWKVG